MYFYKQSKKERLPKLLLIDDFDEFYRMYPQKKAKKDAQVMWSRLDEKSKTLAVE
jgi:hypothetical protein